MKEPQIGEYASRPAPLFEPARIVLAKGAATTSERRRLTQRICAAYPRVEVVEMPGVPHNRVRLDVPGALDLHECGKRTLVLAAHESALRFSTEAGNSCPNYWHFSPYGFCPYGCDYCYLAGTQGVWFSPTVKVFVNLPEILTEITATADRLAAPTAFYLGKLQDGLALDPLTGYSRRIIPFFAAHRYARLTLLTKCADVANLLDLDHRGHSILSWTVNAPAVARRFESNTPAVEDRVAAMLRCSEAGYPVRAVLMPIVPVPEWREAYPEFLRDLLRRVPLARITLGSICSYPRALRLSELKLGPDNGISTLVDRQTRKLGDGRFRFPQPMREEVYRVLVETIRQSAPGLEIGLCLEDRTVLAAVGLEQSLGACNCVL